MQVPRTIAPGLTLGAALSNSTREQPCASLPVTTRRIGLIAAVMSRIPRRPRVVLSGQFDEDDDAGCNDGTSDVRHLYDPRPARSRFVRRCGMRAGVSEPADQADRRPEPR